MQLQFWLVQARLESRARRSPGHPALLFKGATVTYSALEHSSDAFACALLSLGVAAGDRVALLLPNCPQFVIAELAAWKIGAIVAPLNPLHAEPELQSALHDTGAETIVTLTRYYDLTYHERASTTPRSER